MTTRTEPPPSIGAREEAAYWHAALRGPELSPTQQARWEQWIAEPGNQRVFHEATELWSMLGYADCSQWPTDADIAADQYDGSESIMQWRMRQSARPEQAEPSHRTRWLGLVAVLLAMFGSVTWLALRVPATFSTGIAEHRQITLSDGTAIELGGKSSLRAVISSTQRSTTLDGGEALFVAEHDLQRPFRVTAGAATTTTLGAEFNMRRRDNGDVTVTVVAGSLVIAPHAAAAGRQLHQGQQLTYDATGHFGEIHAVTDDSPLSWRDGLLVYEGEPLQAVASDLNRYSSRHIELGDAAAGRVPLTGVVFALDLGNWLPLMHRAFPALEIVEDEQRVLIRTRSETEKSQ
jgi:transmembrane sensor